MIAIVSNRIDIPAYMVMVELDRLGQPYALLDVAAFPGNNTITQTISNESLDTSFTADGGAQVNIRDVRSVWYRKPDVPQLDPALLPSEKGFVYDEIRSGLRGLYTAMAGAHWMSPPDRIEFASNKLMQLRKAVDLGFHVPKTIFTNDPVAAREFVDSLKSPVAFKSIGDGFLFTREGPWERHQVTGNIYTTILDKNTIDEGLTRLHACPALLQEYVEKDYELRITVVGREVFAAELHSQSDARTHADWRQGDATEIDHRPHELDERIRDKCIRLVHELGLDFGAIDMIRTPDGRYVFLEINPNGQYAWIENMVGFKISRAIAEHLSRD